VLKIAVCDDNESFLETLKKIISENAINYFKDVNVVYQKLKYAFLGKFGKHKGRL